MKDGELFKVMSLDPLGEIEDRTGIHHSHPVLGDLATVVSIPLFQAKGAVIEREMRARGDTFPEMTLSDYENALAAEGFELVLTEPVEVHSYSAPSDLLVHAHPAGMLAYVCTYGEDRRPGGMNPNLVLNWRGDTSALPFGFSGTTTKAETTDLRINIDTGLRLRLAALRALGEVVSPWEKQPFIYLLSYKEGCDRQSFGTYKALNAERIAKLPTWVRAFMESPAPDTPLKRSKPA